MHPAVPAGTEHRQPPAPATPAPAADETAVPARPAGRRSYGGLLLAVGLYALLRWIAIAVLAVYLAADPRHWTLSFVLAGRYDSIWYTGLAQHGYDTAIPLTAAGGPAPTNLAFYPLYPWLISAADAVLPGGVRVAALAVAWSLGLVAAAALYLLGAHLRDRRTGVLLAGLWAVLPHGLVQSMGYTETLLTATGVLGMYFALRRNWLAAAGFCVLAGLTGPVSAAPIAAVGLAALVAVIRRPADRAAWAAGAIAPLGLLGYMAWVGYRLGRWDGYFYVQREAWKFGFDDGRSSARTANLLLTANTSLAVAVTTGVVLAAIVLWVILLGERVPWPLLVYAGVALLIEILGYSYYTSKARLLTSALPVLLLPIAAALARSRNRLAAPAVLAGLTAVSAGYGVYLCLVWKLSP